MMVVEGAGTKNRHTDRRRCTLYKKFILPCQERIQGVEYWWVNPGDVKSI